MIKRMGVELRDSPESQRFEKMAGWMSLWPIAMMGLALLAQPDLFSYSPSYTTLNSWMPETCWAIYLVICSCARVASLRVSSESSYGAEMSILASVLGAVFWMQFCLGFFLAYMSGLGALAPVAGYSGWLVVEMYNLSRGVRDRAVRGSRHWMS